VRKPRNDKRVRDSRFTHSVYYACDRHQLSKLLVIHTAVLLGYGWPADPGRFVGMVALVWLSQSHPVAAVMQIVFADRGCRAT
jgi:hypothetical protein